MESLKVIYAVVDDLYLLFNDLGFDMTNEEAEIKFRDCLVGAWLKQVGVAARVDGKIALRAEFDLNLSAIKILTDSGYKVEAGALLNMENAAYPTLDAAFVEYIIEETYPEIFE